MNTSDEQLLVRIVEKIQMRLDVGLTIDTLPQGIGRILDSCHHHKSFSLQD